MSPYDDALKKSYMMGPDQSIFEASNPYSEALDEANYEMGKETLLKQATAPSVDFKKSSLQEQMPEKSVGSQMVGSGGDALIMFGDPSMKALGLGLKTVQAIDQAKQQQKMNEYNAKVRRIQARQEALNKLAQIGQGLKA